MTQKEYLSDASAGYSCPLHSAARKTTERKGYGVCLPNPKSVPEIGNVQYNDYAYMKYAPLQGGAPWLSNMISILTEVCGDY